MLVSEQTISVGELSSFLLYAAYTGVSISGLSTFYSDINRGLGASSRIWEIIDRKPSIPISGNLLIFKCYLLKYYKLITYIDLMFI